MAQQRPALTKTLSAFDFDVVTDAPPPPRIRPPEAVTPPGNATLSEHDAAETPVPESRSRGA